MFKKLRNKIKGKDEEIKPQLIPHEKEESKSSSKPAAAASQAPASNASKAPASTASKQ